MKSKTILLFLLSFICSISYSQNFIKIKTRMQSASKANSRIHNQNGKIEAGATQQGWWSAQWELEKVDAKYVRIKNRWKKTYLHNQNGKLEVGTIQPGWWSAQWELEKVGNSNFYRIKNRWKGDQYIHFENASIAVGKIQSGWWSAQWELEGYSSKPKENNTVSEVAWMTRHYELLKDKPLNKIALPGSHDSGTHNLDGTWSNSVSDAFAPDTDDTKRGLSFLGPGYDKWAKAQERTIYQQLEDGIRYLDIRVCVDKSGTMKTCHGLYGVSLATVVNDVVKFANKYPKETILLDFNHFYDWSEKTKNGKENEAGYQGIRQSKLDELAGMIERTIGPRLAPNSLNPNSKLKDIVATGRPLIVLWDKTPSGSFQRTYFWRTSEIVNSWAGDIQEIRRDKINHLGNKLRANSSNTTKFFTLAGQITPSHEFYKRSYDFTGNYPFGLESTAKQSNPVVLSYVANEWKNLQHNIISIDFYNQTSLVALCKQLNGLPNANPRGVSKADRDKSNWGKWKLGAGDIFAGDSEAKWKVEIDACHSDLDDTGTGSRITVEFYAGNQKVGGKYKNGVSSGCKVWETDAAFAIETGRTITHVIVKTNGSDAFYIDELRLYKGGELKKHEGRDDGSGWCLSTDAGDANGDWKGKVSGSTCKSSYRFNF